MHRMLVACVIAVAATALSCAAAAVQPGATTTGFIQNGDVRLSYQLDTPAGRPPFPAVVIGHGSGQTRKENCRFLSRPMLQRGYATLCYDKRGVGDSTGVYVNIGREGSEARFDLLASDMEAGVRFLRASRNIDALRIGLIGNSQAGWIMPIAASRAKPAFMIVFAGPTVSVGEEIYYSRFAEQGTTPLAEANEMLKTFSGPHGFDPRPVLETLEAPGLWLLGAQDRSIPTPRTVAILDDLIRRGRPFAHVVFPNAGHDLGGADVFAEIDRWLEKQFR
jgi:pimeloyl-ACP methyl ester carboxylesterase